jgi:hypothetical protein
MFAKIKKNLQENFHATLDNIRDINKETKMESASLYREVKSKNILYLFDQFPIFIQNQLFV